MRGSRLGRRSPLRTGSRVGPAGPADAYGTLACLSGNLIGEGDIVVMVGIGADPS